MIFCVEDDASVRDIEVYTLKSTGFDARGLTDGKELFAALETETPDLIILDVMLPGESGVEILRKLRTEKKTRYIPIIMATAKGAEYDKISSLDLGADDYLVKPFGMMEMVARIKAVLRRTAPRPSSAILKLGDLTMNVDEHTVTAREERIQLTLKEFDMLHLFMSQPGMVFTREQLLSEIWDVDYCGETRTVDVHIRTLRHKLGTSGDLIETVRGVGYKMEESHS